MNSGLSVVGICGLVAAIIVTDRGVATGILVGLLFTFVAMILIYYEARLFDEIPTTRQGIPKDEY